MRGQTLTPRALQKVFASAAIALSTFGTPLATHALFEDPLAGVELKKSGNGFIPRTADVGVREFLVKEGREHLRLALPTTSDFSFMSTTRSNGDPARKITDDLELIRIRLQQVGNKNKPAWAGCQSDVADISNLLQKNRDLLLSKSSNPGAAKSILDSKFTPLFTQLAAAVRTEDVQETFRLQAEAADAFSEFNQARLPKGLPYEIPSEYSSLPRLEGRAEVELVVKKAKGVFKISDTFTTDTVTFVVAVDGYSHPLSAGNFVDLVKQKHYDGVKFKSEELIAQTTGTQSARRIPLELFYKADSIPTYGITADDEDRALDVQLLPFQAVGAVGLARDVDDVDSASEDFFFLKWKQGLVPPGRNTIDGNLACFGYIVSGNEDLITQIRGGDSIVSAKVTKGAELLVAGK